MLPRRVIIEHSLDVMECLLLRGRDERTIRAINTIHEIGPRLAQAIHRRDSLRAEKNILSGRFRTADAAGKEALRARSKEITADIEKAEDDANSLSREIEECERIIPNIPATDVPLPSHLSDDEAAWKRLLLRRVHRLIAEENGPAMVDPEISQSVEGA